MCDRVFRVVDDPSLPGNDKPAMWRKVQRGYSGKRVVGEGLVELRVG